MSKTIDSNFHGKLSIEGWTWWLRAHVKDLDVIYLVIGGSFTNEIDPQTSLALTITEGETIEEMIDTMCAQTNTRWFFKYSGVHGDPADRGKEMPPYDSYNKMLSDTSVLDLYPLAKAKVNTH